MSTSEGDPAAAGQREPTEEELRAAYEAEIKKVRVEHVLLEHVVTLVNLGMRRTGLAPGTESERDAGQVRIAVEALRALMPLVEQSAPQQVGPIREALSQLQLAYVRIGGAPGAGAQGAPPQESGPGGAQGSEGSPGGSRGSGGSPGGSRGSGGSEGSEGSPGGSEGSGGPSGGTPGGSPGGQPPPREPESPQSPPSKPGEPGPAQRSGRLWVPGQ
jgi:hypothetical protein